MAAGRAAGRARVLGDSLTAQRPERPTRCNDMQFASTSREPRRRAAVAVAVMMLVLGSFAVRPAAQPVFRSGTDLVALQVTVVDAQRRYAADLKKEDFAVFDDGRPQAIEMFSSTAVPLDVMLLLDSSSSMNSRVDTVSRAAVNLIRALGPDDRAEIIFFSTRVRIEQELTANRRHLLAAIGRLNASGSTALYEAVYIALKRLARSNDGTRAARRQAIVVLSDGDDTRSHVSFADIRNDARNGTAAIYAIIPPDPQAAGHSAPSPESLFDLKLLAHDSGGRSFTPQQTQDLIGVNAEIAEEFRQQYWLAYAPPATTPGFHRVDVRIPAHAMLRARTRTGYNAGTRFSGERR